MNLYECFLKNVKKYPDKYALIINDKAYTYKELYKLVENFPYDFKPNTHIGVLLENSIEFVVLLLLAAKKNFVLIPLAPNTPKSQLKRFFEKCDIEVVITQEGIKYYKNIKKLKNDAYIITTTSGSTSEPKPIVLTQDIKLKRIEKAIEIYN